MLLIWLVNPLMAFCLMGWQIGMATAAALSPEDIKTIRAKFMKEVLSKPQFSEMRSHMEKMARRPPVQRDQFIDPKVLKRISDLEKHAKEDQKLRDVVTGPSLEKANQPIFDMMHQGDMLLNNEQMRDIERSERSVILHDQIAAGMPVDDNSLVATDEPFRRRRRRKRQILSAKKYGYPKTKWDPDTPISYYFNFDINSDLQEIVREAIKFWELNSCLKFKENGTVEPRLRYFRGMGCYSMVGKQYKDFEQDVSLGNGCELFGVAAHETGHAFGLFHHQSRFDRDEFVELTLNIPGMWTAQYNKVDKEMGTTMDVHYDYGSDLHYPGYEQQTSRVLLVAKNKAYQHTMGNRREPSFLDVKLVNDFYECPKRCNPPPRCENGGFPRAHNCSECICPSGFGGADCSQRAGGAFGAPVECGKTIEVNADGEWQKLNAKVEAVGKTYDKGMTLRQAECHFHLKAPANHQIEIRPETVHGECTNECYYGATEIKFEDMEWTGARLCCPSHIKDLDGTLKTTKGLAVVSVYSQKATQSVGLSYRAVKHDVPVVATTTAAPSIDRRGPSFPFEDNDEKEEKQEQRKMNRRSDESEPTEAGKPAEPDSKPETANPNPPEQSPVAGPNPEVQPTPSEPNPSNPALPEEPSKPENPAEPPKPVENPQPEATPSESKPENPSESKPLPPTIPNDAEPPQPPESTNPQPPPQNPQPWERTPQQPQPWGPQQPWRQPFPQQPPYSPRPQPNGPNPYPPNGQNPQRPPFPQPNPPNRPFPQPVDGSRLPYSPSNPQQPNRPMPPSNPHELPNPYRPPQPNPPNRRPNSDADKWERPHTESNPWGTRNPQPRPPNQWPRNPQTPNGWPRPPQPQNPEPWERPHPIPSVPQPPPPSPSDGFRRPGENPQPPPSAPQPWEQPEPANPQPPPPEPQNPQPRSPWEETKPTPWQPPPQPRPDPSQPEAQKPWSRPYPAVPHVAEPWERPHSQPWPRPPQQPQPWERPTEARTDLEPQPVERPNPQPSEPPASEPWQRPTEPPTEPGAPRPWERRDPQPAALNPQPANPWEPAAPQPPTPPAAPQPPTPPQPPSPWEQPGPPASPQPPSPQPWERPNPPPPSPWGQPAAPQPNPQPWGQPAPPPPQRPDAQPSVPTPPQQPNPPAAPQPIPPSPPPPSEPKKAECKDVAVNCPFQVRHCRAAANTEMMRRYCPVTCGFCGAV